jgi:preprotein translocase subunit SecD
MANLRWKIITIVAVLIIFSAVGVYPIVASYFGIQSPAWLISRQLKLGLDLRGGVHLVLRVRTDDALRFETEAEMARLAESLQRQNITVMMTQVDAMRFRVDGVTSEQDPAFRAAANEVSTNYDRGPGANDLHAAGKRRGDPARRSRDASARHD